MRRVDAVDVEGRVGFRVAKLLRFLQHLREFALLLAHRGQDVVAGAVEDAGDALDAVRRQALAHGLDGRDAAGDRGFEGECDALGLGCLGKGRAMHREQRLVGGHDMLAGGERRLDQRLGGTVGPADAFHHNLDLRIGGERHRILVPAQAGKRDAAVTRPVAGGDGGDGDRPSGARGDDVRIRAQHVDDPGADRSQAGDRNGKRTVHALVSSC